MIIDKIKYCFFVCSFCYSIAAHAQSKPADTITLGKVLSSFYDVSQLPLYMEQTYSAQFSSYDTTGGNDDGFSGKTSFIRRNTDSSLVIFEVKGAGVINRIWTPTPTEDTLDFFLDGSKKPSLSIKYTDLFSGKVQPFIAPLCGNDLGGFYCYLPILFNNGCTIVCRGKKMQFHQLGYRLFAAAAVVKTFTAVLSAADINALHIIQGLYTKTNRQFSDFKNETPGAGLVKTVSKEIDLLPGQSTIVFSAATCGRIEGIEISPAASFEGLHKLIDIEITWDDDTQPAVFCPLADFFGYAFGKPAMQSLLLGTNDQANYCYIPMPFDKKATVRLRYRNAQAGEMALPVKIKSTVYYSGSKRIPAKEGRFYTSWNRDAATGQPHVFINTHARGHYIGTVLQAQGLRPGMTYFFEGDDSTVADGTMRMHGTGSEDYFNGGWYALADRWDGKLSLPLHGCLEYSLPFSRTGAYRFYLSDKISFEKNIFSSIEHGPSGNTTAVDYTSLGFYYADRAPETITVPNNALTKVYMPDTLIMYPQLMNAGIENKISVSTSWAYNTGGLSYTYTADNESAIKFLIDEIPNGKYRLQADFVRNAAGAEFSFWQGQHNISGWMQAYAPNEIVEKGIFIANLERSASRNTLTIHFRTLPGKDKLILNRLVFVRLRE